MKRALLLLFLPLVLAAAQEAAPPVAVTYTMDATNPASGEVSVEMLVENNRDDEVTIGIPTWAPGSYRLVSYYLGVHNLEAVVGGQKVEAVPTDVKWLWKVKTGRQKNFTLRYTLKPGDVPPLRGHLAEDHYDLQGPSAWLYVLNRMDGPHKVTFKVPVDWKVGTGLTPLGPMTFGARDYDTFIDCPTELGKFSLEKFTEGGVAYELVIHATEAFDVDKLIDVHRKIVAEQMRMFGGAPFDRYVFIYHFREQRGGAGLEHLNSTHITFPMIRIKADPTSIASLTSHEFFHLWNVKRIRPKELGPFDYTQPVRSKALWLCEGVTSYYGDLSLARAGVWSRDVYFAHLASEATILQSNPARLTQSVEEASRTVWDRPRGGRTVAVDYYNKGELLGWLLDLKIRQATGGRKSFDDVMRNLYKSHVVEPSKKGRGPIGVGFEEGAILKAVNEVSGTDFADFFAKYVAGTEELPYAEVARGAGLSIARPHALPVTLRDMKVTARAPASRDTGIRMGDKIEKVNGTPVATVQEVFKLLESMKLGDKVTVDVAGEKEPVQIELPVVQGDYVLRVMDDATAGQKDLLQGWLAPSK
jgi:predicted metalloprotease with PDZ domain